MANEQGYRVPEVTKAVGISYRQLDYWARTGLVTPSIREAGGSGTQRLYSFQDMLVLRIIKKLLDAGIGLQQIRKAVEYLKDRMQALGERVGSPDSAASAEPTGPGALEARLEELAAAHARLSQRLGELEQRAGAPSQDESPGPLA